MIKFCKISRDQQKLNKGICYQCACHIILHLYIKCISGTPLPATNDQQEILYTVNFLYCLCK